MKKLLTIFLALAFATIAHAQTINNLNPGSAVSGTDLFPAYQGANPATAVSANQIKTFIAPSGVPAAANPTAQVGPAAVNGAAATFMRSDAAPAINLGAGYNWTGAHTFTSNVTVQGLLSSTANTTPASATNSGVAMSAAPNVADLLFFDSTQSANNRTYEILAFSGGLQFRFKNDAGNSATAWLQAFGGQAAGISGITSNSGTGTWAHTGALSTTLYMGALDTTTTVSLPTNSGTYILGNNSIEQVVQQNSGLSAGNRRSVLEFSGGSGFVGFMNDQTGTRIAAVQWTGGAASGITGITSNSGSGAWAHTGTFSSSGAITPTGGIVGVSTNSNAAAGNVGELITSTGTGVALTSTTPANLTSVSLTAGDWECTGSTVTNFSTTLTAIELWISTVSATNPGWPNANGYSKSAGGAVNITQNVGPMRLSLASTTTVFIGTQQVFGGTETATGLIRCRRER